VEESASSQTDGVSPDWFEAGLHHIALGAEVVGVAAIVLGAVLAFAVCIGRLTVGRDRSGAMVNPGVRVQAAACSPAS
jgi:hypothetical protein